MASSEPLRAGVIGVGSMGQNHVRIYQELPDVELVGVFDADADRATTIADEFDTDAYPMDELLERIDVASIAVPTRYHDTVARTCIEADVHVLVEKPFVEDPAEGRRLIELAEERDVVLQVGHVERFNPAVRTLMEILEDLDVIAVNAERLGPPPNREIEDTAVMDLMIHDVDILLALVDDEVVKVDAVGTREARYAAATVQFDSGIIAQLTASRVTQEKVRQLTITAENERVKLDYIDQRIQIHRQSVPEFVNEGDVRYRHENIVEELTVDRGEPLKNELAAFVEAARTGSEPVVTGEDGLRALEVTRQFDALATTAPGSNDTRERYGTLPNVTRE